MYDTLKSYKSQIYTGMKIGGTHNWNYTNGKWTETKITPDKWIIKFESIKTRMHTAPIDSGASIGSKFHWYIIADQIATKLDNDSYMTDMKGFKYKIGHKRPKWRSFSYEYPEQEAYRERVIKILEDTLNKLKNNKINSEKFI